MLSRRSFSKLLAGAAAWPLFETARAANLPASLRPRQTPARRFLRAWINTGQHYRADVSVAVLGKSGGVVRGKNDPYYALIDRNGKIAGEHKAQVERMRFGG